MKMLCADSVVEDLKCSCSDDLFVAEDAEIFVEYQAKAANEPRRRCLNLLHTISVVLCYMPCMWAPHDPRTRSFHRRLKRAASSLA